MQRRPDIAASATTGAAPVSDAEFAATLMPSIDPVAAAVAWLDDPARRASLPEPLLLRARRTVEIASDHYRQLDLVAGEVALDANATGHVDAARVRAVQDMAETLQRYSVQLRELLDAAGEEPGRSETRLDAALTAASSGGGLPALVAAL